MNEWISESVVQIINEWVSQWINESLNQKMNELSESKSQSMHEWLNGLDCNGMEWNGMEWKGMEWKGINGMQRNATQWNGMEWKGWISESMNQWITEWTNEWMDRWMERWMDGWMDLLLHRATSLLRYLLNTPWMAPFLSVNPPDEKPMLSGGCLIFNISGGWDLCCWHTLFSGKNLRLEFFLMQDSDHFQDEKSRQLC